MELLDRVEQAHEAFHAAFQLSLSSNGKVNAQGTAWHVGPGRARQGV